MKGAVFIALNEMIEERFDIETWESILAEVKPICEGIYTSTEDYPDAEMMRFVLCVSNKLKLPTSTVTRMFGQYLFLELNGTYPMFSKQSANLFEFLESIESVIHKEVKKLFDNPNLPTLGTDINKNVLMMTYTSSRKLCFLAEGLIFGAAEYYNEKIHITHEICMHDGHDHCELKVTMDE